MPLKSRTLYNLNSRKGKSLIIVQDFLILSPGQNNHVEYSLVATGWASDQEAYTVKLTTELVKNITHYHSAYQLSQLKLNINTAMATKLF